MDEEITMPSLTPLHETYCKWDRSPPSQADVLEGLAQLVSTPLSGMVQDFIQSIQREMLLSIFGLSKQKAKRSNPVQLSINSINLVITHCKIMVAT